MARARRPAALAAVVLAVSLALAGCSQSSSGTKPTPKPVSSVPGALDSLVPVMPKTLTAATAKTATDDLAKQIDSLVAATDIVYIDNHEKLIPASSTVPASYAIIRTINVSPSLDPVEQATAMEKLLVAAGWTKKDTTSATGKYLAALSSSKDSSRAWFLLLGGDSTVATQPVVTVQLASPDIPKK
ncbi:MAG: hypothetical protein WDM88_11825 [Galbitalea sp.]